MIIVAVGNSARIRDYYVSSFLDLADHVTVNAIAGDYPSGCDAAAPGSGWYEGSVATGGAFLSICGDPSTTLRDLAEAVTAYQPGEYDLSDWPMEATLVVAVDGVEVSGWTYDPGDNAVVVDPAPADGAVIEITYVAYPACS